MLSKNLSNSDTKRPLYIIVTNLISKLHFKLVVCLNFLDAIMHMFFINNNRCTNRFLIMSIVYQLTRKKIIGDLKKKQDFLSTKTRVKIIISFDIRDLDSSNINHQFLSVKNIHIFH